MVVEVKLDMAWNALMHALTVRPSLPAVILRQLQAREYRDTEVRRRHRPALLVPALLFGCTQYFVGPCAVGPTGSPSARKA